MMTPLPSTDSPKNALMLALDVDSPAAAQAVIEAARGHVGYFKIGSELFLQCGADVVRQLHALGEQTFIDLKLHDIPRTVGAGCRELRKLGCAYLTVHAGGGYDMLKAAVDAADSAVLAVTVLTSHSDQTLRELGVDGSTLSHTLRLAELAARARVGGFVCSAWEVETMSRTFGPEFAYVCPGIRSGTEPADDQKRTRRARDAIAAGASHLVIGRPILSALPDPIAPRCQHFTAEIEAGRQLRSHTT